MDGFHAGHRREFGNAARIDRDRDAVIDTLHPVDYLTARIRDRGQKRLLTRVQRYHVVPHLAGRGGADLHLCGGAVLRHRGWRTAEDGSFSLRGLQRLGIEHRRGRCIHLHHYVDRALQTGGQASLLARSASGACHVGLRRA